PGSAGAARPGPVPVPPPAAPTVAARALDEPVRLTLVIVQPADTAVSLVCAGRSRPCRDSCTVTLDPGAACQLRAPGFVSRALRHGDLARLAHDGRLTQRVTLVPMKL